jgi:hypothetical protein
MEVLAESNEVQMTDLQTNTQSAQVIDPRKPALTRLFELGTALSRHKDPELSAVGSAIVTLSLEAEAEQGA